MSYLFNGDTQIITFPDAPALDSTGTHTLSYWINLTASGVTMVPVSKMGNYFGYLDAAYGERTIHGNYKAAGDVYRGISTTAWTMTMMIGAWHNIIVRTSGDAPGAVWIDGVNRTEDIDNFWFTATRDLTQLLTIGNNLGLTAPLKGYIAEVAIWNNLSIADAIAGDVAGGLSPVGLSTPPTWYARLKDNAVEHYSSVAGTISGATLNASHPLVDAPSGGIPFDVLQNFSSGSGALDSAKLEAGVHGADWGTWQSVPGFTVDHTVIEDHAIALPFSLDIGGTEYDGSEGQGITFDLSVDDGNTDTFELLAPAATYSDVQVLALVQWAITDGGGGSDYNNDILNVSGGAYTVAQFHYGGDGSAGLRYIYAHSEAALGTRISYDAGGWVIVGVKHDAVNQVGEIFMANAATGNFIGASASEHSTPAGTLVFIRFQDYSRLAGNSKFGAIKIKLIALREEIATFPPYPVTVPPIVPVSCAQTDVGKIDLEWTSACTRHIIERRINGGSWGVVDSDHHNVAYTETGLTDGSVYEYRITAFVGSQFSVVEDGFDPVTIDDFAFAGGGELFLSTTIAETLVVPYQLGMNFTVGSEPIILTHLGLWILASQFSDTLGVGIYTSGGTLIDSVVVSTLGTPNQYEFVALTTPIELTASTTYWLMTSPLGYNDVKNSTVTTSGIITVNGSAYGTAPSFAIASPGLFVSGPVNAIWAPVGGGEPETSPRNSVCTII